LQQIPAPDSQSAATAAPVFEQLKQDEPREQLPSETDHAPPLG
jgi:hypothetical protein